MSRVLRGVVFAFCMFTVSHAFAANKDKKEAAPEPPKPAHICAPNADPSIGDVLGCHNKVIENFEQRFARSEARTASLQGKLRGLQRKFKELEQKLSASPSGASGGESFSLATTLATVGRQAAELKSLNARLTALEQAPKYNKEALVAEVQGAVQTYVDTALQEVNTRLTALESDLKDLRETVEKGVKPRVPRATVGLTGGVTRSNSDDGSRSVTVDVSVLFPLNGSGLGVEANAGLGSAGTDEGEHVLATRTSVLLRGPIITEGFALAVGPVLYLSERGFTGEMVERLMGVDIGLRFGIGEKVEIRLDGLVGTQRFSGHDSAAGLGASLGVQFGF